MALSGKWQTLRRRFVDHEISALVAIVLIATCAWIFAEVADGLGDAELHEVDTRILLSLRNDADRSDPLGPPWVEESWRDVTALGSMPILALFTALVVGFLLLEKKYRTAVFIFVSVVGGSALSLFVKSLFQRPRPDLVEAGARVLTSSFPSAHSMMSAVTLLSVASLLATVQRRRRIKAYLFVAAVTVMVLVGISRVYLGVHWPSDVLAGWALGAAWALLCALVAKAFSHGRPDESGPGPA